MIGFCVLTGIAAVDVAVTASSGASNSDPGLWGFG